MIDIQKDFSEQLFFKNDPHKTYEDSFLQVWEVDISVESIPDFLSHIDVHPQFYFQARDGSEYAGVGSINNQLKNPLSFEEFYKNVPSVFFYQKEYNWQQLPHKTFDLPEIAICPLQIIRSKSKTILRSLELTGSKAHYPFIHSEKRPFPLIQKNELTPSFMQWLSMFEELNKLWGDLKKVVPARRHTLSLDQTLPVHSFFKQVQSNGQYNFMICKNSETAFLGSSPERLLSFENTQIQTEAVAGTRPKNQAQELLISEKDLKEHQWVVEDIYKNLKPFTDKITCDSKPSLIESKNLAHLKTSLVAEVQTPQVLDWIDSLSPTAAICGFPRPLALQTLQKFEPFQRGFYSAPVGIFDKTSADICVAIRSCYLSTNQLELFSGVGVIPESHAKLEWDELDIKIKPYLNLLK